MENVVSKWGFCSGFGRKGTCVNLYKRAWQVGFDRQPKGLKDFGLSNRTVKIGGTVFSSSKACFRRCLNESIKIQPSPSLLFPPYVLESFRV